MCCENSAVESSDESGLFIYSALSPAGYQVVMSRSIPRNVVAVSYAGTGRIPGQLTHMEAGNLMQSTSSSRWARRDIFPEIGSTNRRIQFPMRSRKRREEAETWSVLNDEHEFQGV